jgi:hypothetical protein
VIFCNTGRSFIFINWTIRTIKNSSEINMYTVYVYMCRSQWPRGLRHEQSSSALTLESWVLNPLKAWMSVCVYSVVVLFCV